MDHPEPRVETPSPLASSAVPDMEAALDRLLAVSPGGLAHARPAEPALNLVSRDPHQFLVVTPFHHVSGDLAQGLVLQALRLPDGTTGAPVCHSGNLLEYRHLGRKVTLDVESHIEDFAIERLPGAVLLRHESRFRRPVPSLGRTRDLARLRYEYLILADSPVLHLTVTLLPEPGVRLRGLRLTTALDALSPEGTPGMGRLLAWGQAGGRSGGVACPSGTAALHTGP
ncbi:MAG: hypothetical protein K2X74_00730, partial [Acetobacteraceae bacterium]|nr:hypothetical protein [Acetobacteraceae bacterium]